MEALRGQLRQMCACRARRPNGGVPGGSGPGGRPEDVDVELLAGTDNSPTQESSGGSPGGRCIRCRRNRVGKYFCQVAVKSIYDGGRSDPCPHGPYCAVCQKKLGHMTLSSCACRAMIQSWL
mmetsp:Transcript_56602/g.123810  ORF Transcript_56602/g.123810 Transcript_56602/m.123810 type:complete len:122 (+) Transcript_56602:136-501(+)|eukprot:CAMPEP_0206460438 /NCGR_PEP_ID=MMETSP0324_2-20121206/24752_1 /ASSEMBLY_ACC=CAM_ASM_000836 /TAXON_ID=2866 /ORGANISM="Crypthecodinium cohnii, Strain Seligo" /LENGTH=121 /DNA_ID=CAMNT_0053932141 /DNA_START=601 /DNA_END=966 /DNA_ORIENTATION=+